MARSLAKPNPREKIFSTNLAGITKVGADDPPNGTMTDQIEGRAE
jgi:hypothetical protein